jgi:hypothetical protein
MPLQKRPHIFAVTAVANGLDDIAHFAPGSAPGIDAFESSVHASLGVTLGPAVVPLMALESSEDITSGLDFVSEDRGSLLSWAFR